MEFILENGQRIIRLYGVITNDVSDYINLLVTIARIVCNHTLYSAVLR
jgi:hypothetical protein